MTVRKGELSKARIDREFPFQVAYHQPEMQSSELYIRAEAICKGLSCCLRGHTFVRDDQWWLVKCFAKEEDAEIFMAAIGGERYDPKHPVMWGSGSKRR